MMLSSAPTMFVSLADADENSSSRSRISQDMSAEGLVQDGSWMNAMWNSVSTGILFASLILGSIAFRKMPVDGSPQGIKHVGAWAARRLTPRSGLVVDLSHQFYFHTRLPIRNSNAYRYKCYLIRVGGRFHLDCDWW